jgi:hypothetical protein
MTGSIVNCMSFFGYTTSKPWIKHKNLTSWKIINVWRAGSFREGLDRGTHPWSQPWKKAQGVRSTKLEGGGENLGQHDVCSVLSWAPSLGTSVFPSCFLSSWLSHSPEKHTLDWKTCSVDFIRTSPRHWQFILKQYAIYKTQEMKNSGNEKKKIPCLL